jgi:putative membrane protein
MSAGIPLASLPAVNASLNATATVLLVLGYLCIRNKKVQLHRACMVAAFLCSTVFLCFYVYFHLHAGVIRFSGQGWVRAVYFAILIPHTILAIAIVPLILITLSRGLRERYASHRKIARWTLPLWLYVSVTGVIVYWMLYIAFAPIYPPGFGS